MGILTIRIDDELENDLDRLAKVQHRTKSDLAREMLRKHEDYGRCWLVRNESCCDEITPESTQVRKDRRAILGSQIAEPDCGCQSKR